MKRAVCRLVFVCVALLAASVASPCQIPQTWDTAWPQKGVAIRGVVSGYVGPVTESTLGLTGFAVQVTTLEDGEGNLLKGSINFFPTTLTQGCGLAPYADRDAVARNWPLKTKVYSVVERIPSHDEPIAAQIDTWFGSKACTTPSDCTAWELVANSTYRLRWFARRLHTLETDEERAAALEPLLVCPMPFGWKDFLRNTIQDRKLRRALLYKWYRVIGIKVPD